MALAPDPDDDAPLPPVMVCLTACETSSDCADGEVCRVVCGSDELMSCQTGALPSFPADICGNEEVVSEDLL